MPAFEGIAPAAIGIGLLKKLTPKLHQKRSKVLLTQLIPPTDKDGMTFAFQYYPEVVTDNVTTTYSAKQVPGGSLPLYQWVSGGERSVNFTTYFTTDIDPTLESYNKDDLKEMSLLDRNVDVRAALVWLRSFMLPFYDKKNKRLLPPPKAFLEFPKSGIGQTGGTPEGARDRYDGFHCVMKDCNVEYVSSFTSGYPRVVRVTLVFNHICQVAGSVMFPDMDHEEIKKKIEKGWGFDGGYSIKP